MYIVAIDQGTTSSRAIAFDRAGNSPAQAQQEFTQHFPKPGWVEHDPMEILDSVRQTLNDLFQKINPTDVQAVGITNQRETTVIWEADTGKPIYNAIVWQSRQTADICEELRRRGLESEIRYKTGLLIDAYFSATKIRWILNEVPGAQALAEAGKLRFGTIDSWLLWHLSTEQRHATDITNASRTLLFNIHTLEWDADLCKALDIPTNMLPEVTDNAHPFGTLKPEFANGRSGIPISGMAGDQQAALFGQACFLPGQVKNTYGTGCFMLMNTGEKVVTSVNGLLTTLAWRLNGKVEYALEGAIFVAGSAVQWLRDGLGLLADSAESESLAASLPSAEGVYLVPAFVGLGAPYWDSDARGAFFGLTRGTTRAHIARAALESIAYQTKDVLLAMEQDAGLPLLNLRVDGGMTRNNFLLQFQSDLLGVQVDRPVVQETTALGAAYFAGLQTGFWTDTNAISKQWQPDRSFTPQRLPTETDAFYQGWKKAVSATQTFK